MLEVGENLITASQHYCLAGLFRIGRYRMKLNYQNLDAGLSPTDRTSYHGRTPQATLAAEGCELTIIFHNAKNGTTRPYWHTQTS